MSGRGSVLGSVLRSLYLLFTVAAGGRSVVQWLDDPGRAPFAYALSTVALGVYAAGYLVLRREDHGPRARRLLAVLAAVELGGVLVVGTLSVLAPGLFADSTVWSGYGAGYGFVPLLIPVLLLGWLHRSPGGRDADPAHVRSGSPRRRAPRRSPA